MDWVITYTMSAVVLCIPLAFIIGCARLGKGLPIVVAGVYMVLSCAAGVVFVLQGLIFVIASLDHLRSGQTWKTFARTSAILSLIPLGLSWCVMRPILVQFQRLQANYPPQSLASRLAYEGLHPGANGIAPAPIELHGVEAEEGLEEVGRGVGPRLGIFPRSYVLQQLHERTYRQFVIAAGFGPMRMGGFDPHEVTLSPAMPLQLACDPTPATTIAEEGLRDAPGRRCLLGLHWTGAREFLSARRFGAIVGPQVARGFAPHAFTEIPKPFSDVESWRVTRLELVSLLKFDSPRVYETEILPNLGELSSDDIPTRELEPFEAGALPQLSFDRDLVFDAESAPGQIRMLGALRAGDECLKCHSVRRGELLGAFSYLLQPVIPQPNAKPAP